MGKDSTNKQIDKDKAQFSLIPFDILGNLLEPAYREGLLKYSKDSWRDGIKVSKLFDAAMRHLVKFMYYREELDLETLEKTDIKKAHLGAAIFNILTIENTIRNYPDLDDRLNKSKIYKNKLK